MRSVLVPELPGAAIVIVDELKSTPMLGGTEGGEVGGGVGNAAEEFHTPEMAAASTEPKPVARSYPVPVS